MMKKFTCMILLACSSLLMAQNKTIISVYGEKLTHDARITTKERQALPLKTEGMMIYNLTTQCHEFWDGNDWYNYCTRGYSSTGGTAVVNSYDCTTGSSGTMTAGTLITGVVTQTITADVKKIGTYNIIAEANGVTFRGKGSFTATGSQPVVLTATGTPIAVEDTTFTLNTTPDCEFIRTIDEPIDTSTDGTAIVTIYDCTTGSSGTMIAGTTITGVVTQTITADVQKIGTYDIIAEANGVTFRGTDSFTGTGPQPVVLTATGTPIAAVNTTFTLNTTPNCSFTRPIDEPIAIVTHYTCTTNSAGTMIAGTPITGVVTQTITADVQKIGTYDIIAEANGVTFRGTDSFTGTGPQPVVLTATGTPIAAVNTTFTLNTTPNCSFIRAITNPELKIVTDPVVSGPVCRGSGEQTITIEATGATTYQWRSGTTNLTETAGRIGTKTAKLTLIKPTGAGSYNCVIGNGTKTEISKTVTTVVNPLPTVTASTPAWGTTDTSTTVTLSATASAGATISWYAEATGGTPLKTASNTFTTPSISSGETIYYAEAVNANGCASARTAVKATIDPFSVVSPTTHRRWMAKNLGAKRIPITSNDSGGYGDLYQWGRKGTDNHQIINWTSYNSGTAPGGVTYTPNSSPTDSKFILTPEDYSWQSSINSDLWAGDNAPNNPCPDGYRVPTPREFELELSGVTSMAHAFDLFLKIPTSGSRNVSDGSITVGKTNATLWTSNSMASTPRWKARAIRVDEPWMNLYLTHGFGLPVRCIEK